MMIHWVLQIRIILISKDWKGHWENWKKSALNIFVKKEPFKKHARKLNSKDRISYCVINC